MAGVYDGAARADRELHCEGQLTREISFSVAIGGAFWHPRRMAAAVTQGILIEVESQYVPSRSTPDLDEYFFAYTVRISNTGRDVVQLVSRHWIICDGLGKQTALALARLGARLVLVGRNPEKTGAAAAAISAETGHADVEVLIADLSSMAEIRRLAAAFKAKHDRLHVLVNNAGGIFW